MKSKRFTLMATLALAAPPALAEEGLGTDALSALITGNTLYVEVPAGAPGAPDGGVAPIYYGADGAAVAKLPSGLLLVGTWAMAEGSYCIDWDNGPQNSCSTLMRMGDKFVVIDQASGDPRGSVSLIATGNPENL